VLFMIETLWLFADTSESRAKIKVGNLLLVLLIWKFNLLPL
jgi:hypothetical protein